ncbi:MAG TPA: hypothetical protein VJR89_31955 [Polyangiales bacterium]|nr:hypothetical protein [Polyangiales bacterium]
MDFGFAKITLCALAVLCGCAADREVPTSAPTGAAFELVAAAPDVAAPLWVRSPIVLRFSAPLDASSVSAGVRLASDARPVVFAHRVDGAVLTLEITAPPLTPAALDVSITAELRDQTGRAAQPTSRSWQLPVWRTSSAAGVSARAPLLARDRDLTWLAWETESNGAPFIQVAQYSEQTLRSVDALAVEAGARLFDLAIDAEGRPVVAWRAAAAHVARYAGSGWQRLEDGLNAALAPGAELGPRLALGEQGALLVAWPTSAGVELASWSSQGPWQRIAPVWQPAVPLHALDLAWSASGAVLAALVEQPDGRDLQVHRLEAGVWRALSEAVEHDRSDDVRELAIDVGSNGAPLVAWTEVSDGTRRLYVSRYSAETATFQGLGPALNVVPDSDVEQPTLVAGDGMAPVVGFRELSAGDAASYVARWNGFSFEVLGGSLGGRGGPSVALGRQREPLAAIARATTGVIELHHYNESPEPPFGLNARKPQPCTLPADGDAAFPRRLSETRCYAELASQRIAEGWIPYELNSPLWSDGAWKRRFFSIPDGTKIGFTKTDAWELPVGTMLGKEFWLQRDPADRTTRFIVETRLMIKRCEPGSCRAAWQGYSYQWNAAGDEANLLDNNSESVVVHWPLATGVHEHSYPGRDECTKCHALSAGGALGPRTQQLNRNHRYGDVVDNQLRALFHIGLFGDSQPPADLNTLFRLPSPSDPSYDLNARVRGYFDANCAHCHSPTSRWPVVDLRYDAQVRAADASGMTGNICNHVVPGNAEASILYVKLKAVPGAVPEGFPGDTMPPIARRLPDTAQLPRIKSWIERMTTCP